jgi:uncharacterized phage-associated protein
VNAYAVDREQNFTPISLVSLMTGGYDQNDKESRPKARWEMDRFRFNFNKTVQAAGVLLKLENGQMGRLRLLKFLYIADRELHSETARPITGDTGYAMKHGPVLSRVYDLIKGNGSRATEWEKYFRSEGYLVKLVHDPGRGKLSRGEMEKLHDISSRYREFEDEELSELTHQFKEWKDHYQGDGGSYVIPWEQVLEAQGRGDMIQAAREEEQAHRYLDEMFGA